HAMPFRTSINTLEWPRRADRAPAGGTRDTMSWVRGPVRGLLGGKDPTGQFDFQFFVLHSSLVFSQPHSCMRTMKNEERGTKNVESTSHVQRSLLSKHRGRRTRRHRWWRRHWRGSPSTDRRTRFLQA